MFNDREIGCLMTLVLLTPYGPVLLGLSIGRQEVQGLSVFHFSFFAS